MNRNLHLLSCIFLLSSCSLVEKEKAYRLDDIQYAQVQEETNRYLSLWKEEDNFPICKSFNLAEANRISNMYEDEAIRSKFTIRRGMKILPQRIGSRIGRLRMKIADTSYTHGCLDIARKIYVDIHESYNNHLVDAYVPLNTKAKARIVDVDQQQ